jgi:hypothetical protein
MSLGVKHAQLRQPAAFLGSDGKRLRANLLIYAATGGGATAVPAFLASLALTDTTGSGFGGWYAHR